MNHRQRVADSQMRYLGKAWRRGFAGPHERPSASTMWQQLLQQTIPTRMLMDEEKVEQFYQRWVIVSKHSRYQAAVLKLHYRDGYKFPDELITEALDRFSQS